MIEKIKDTVTIDDILNRLSLSTNQSGNTTYLNERCPIGECGKKNKNHTFQIYYDTNTFYCWSCHSTGDIVDFVSAYNKCDKSEAIKWICKEFNIPYDSSSLAGFEGIYRYGKEQLLSNKQSKEYLYLKRRGYKDDEINGME